MAIFAGVLWVAAIGRAQTPALPAAAETLAAYHAIEPWVREWKVPTEAQKLDPAGTTGACVTLRLSGKVLGRAARLADDGTSLWLAVRDAWAEANQSFPVERDAMRAELILEMTPRVMIDIQLGGAFTPLLGDTFDAAAAELSPGIEGVAARVEDVTRAVFPGVMLTTQGTPASALQSATGEIGLPPIELGQLRKIHRLTAYRFPVRHLAQTAPGEEPRFLYRGGAIVPLSAVSEAGLQAFADRAAMHLLQHDWRGPEPHGMTGDYNPITDRFEPPIAGAMEQAVAAMALLEYAATRGAHPATASKTRNFAARLLNDLRTIGAGEEDPLKSVTACAAFVCAWALGARLDARAFSAGDEFFGHALEQVRAARTGGAWAQSLEPPQRALAAFALVRAMSLRADDAELRQQASDAVRSLFRDTARGELVAMMPWLGWAELESAGKTAEIPAREALTEMRELMWTFQLGESDVGPDGADLAGGIIFTRSRQPLPTWAMLRPLAFAATMQGDARFTSDAEFARQLAGLRRSLRFMMQLTFGEESRAVARDARRAMGGVRRSLWDQTAAVDATSLALLTACETLRALSPAEPPATPEMKPAVQAREPE